MSTRNKKISREPKKHSTKKFLQHFFKIAWKRRLNYRKRREVRRKLIDWYVLEKTCRIRLESFEFLAIPYKSFAIREKYASIACFATRLSFLASEAPQGGSQSWELQGFPRFLRSLKTFLPIVARFALFRFTRQFRSSSSVHAPTNATNGRIMLGIKKNGNSQRFPSRQMTRESSFPLRKLRQIRKNALK